MAQFSLYYLLTMRLRKSLKFASILQHKRQKLKRIALFNYFNKKSISRNPDIPAIVFNLNEYDHDRCCIDFRFTKEQLYELLDHLRLPDVFILENRSKLSSIEALCIFCRRMAYPNRYNDLSGMFGRDKHFLSRVFNSVARYAGFNSAVGTFTDAFLIF